MFNAVDVVALIALAIGVFQGMRRRLSGELAHLISVAVAFLVGIFSYRPLGAWLAETGRFGPQSGQAVAFVGAVVASAIIMVMVRVILQKILGSVIEEETDKTAGAVVGFLRATIFVLIVFLVMNLVPQAYLNRKFGNESAIGRMVQSFIPDIREKYQDLDPEKLERLEKLTNGTESFQEDAGGDTFPVRHR